MPIKNFCGQCGSEIEGDDPYCSDACEQASAKDYYDDQRMDQERIESAIDRAEYLIGEK